MLSDQYRLRAEFWDCFFGDRDAEIKFWADWAARYGQRVLAPMCATGEVAAGLRERGLRVLGVDIVAAMVRLGRSRVGDDREIFFLQGDVSALPLRTGAFDFAFLGTGDFHHFLTEDEQRRVLQNLWRILRPGGGLGLALYPPPRGKKGKTSGKKRFPPLRPPADAQVQVWKESETQYHPHNRRLTISQTIFVIDNHQQNKFSYVLNLQLFQQKEMQSLLKSAGFEMVAELGSYQGEPYVTGAADWIVIVEKPAL